MRPEAWHAKSNSRRMVRNHQYEIEGHTVWLLGEGPYRRFFCDCETFQKPKQGGSTSCRHVQIIASKLAGVSINLPPPLQTATILEFKRR